MDQLKNEDRSGGILDEVGWAEYLNKDFKRAVVAASISRYAAQKGESGHIGQAWPVIWRSLLMGDLLIGSTDAKISAITWGGFGVFRRVVQLGYVMRGEAKLTDFNPSFINSFRLDRIVATALYASTHNLIKVAK